MNNNFKKFKYSPKTGKRFTTSIVTKQMFIDNPISSYKSIS